MLKIIVTRVLCMHCNEITQDVPEFLKGNPNVVIETAKGFCPKVSYADREQVRRRPREIAENNAKKEGA